MRTTHALSLAAGLAAAVGIAGCVSSSAPSRAKFETPPSAPPTINLQEFPDAVPRIEPRARYGNPPFYDVFGRRYYVLSSSKDYVERGVASWYGPGFHEIQTSTHEPYDMYGMTAAHRTLPLPAYARVTNLENGRSVVVRVNDRGPFVGNRIIDLSYTAALRLDMLRNGTAMVEVRAIDPATPGGSGAPLMGGAPAVTPTLTPTLATTLSPTLTTTQTTTTALTAPTALRPAVLPALFVQAGAFADPANAERLAARLGSAYGRVFVRGDVIGGRKLYRVRIGPVPDVPEFDRIVAALEQVGVQDARLASD